MVSAVGSFFFMVDDPFSSGGFLPSINDKGKAVMNESVIGGGISSQHIPVPSGGFMASTRSSYRHPQPSFNDVVSMGDGIEVASSKDDSNSGATSLQSQDMGQVGELQVTNTIGPYYCSAGEGGKGYVDKLNEKGWATVRGKDQFSTGTIIAFRMIVGSGGTQQLSFNLGDNNRVMGDIILAPRDGLAEEKDKSIVDPLLEYHGSEENGEGTNNDNFEDMDSINSSEVSFTTKLQTLSQSVAFPKNQPSHDAPKAVLTRKRVRDMDVGIEASIPIANRFDALTQDSLFDIQT